MSDEVPPLKLWAYPVAAVVAIVASFIFYTYSAFGPYETVLKRSNQSIQEALIENARDTSALSIVILGSSLTEHALFDAREIEDSISRITHKKTNVLRLAMNFMDFDLARRINFFDYIRRYPSKYLFIENYCINMDNGDSSLIPLPIDASLMQIRNQIRNLVGVQTKDNYYTKWYSFDGKPQQEEYYGHSFDSVVFRTLLMKHSAVRGASRNEVANNAYASLIKQNKKVIFLDMPESDKLAKNFLDKASTSELEELLKLYQSKYRVEYWRYPVVMSDSCFVDGVHLNSVGAAQYQKWFVSEIATRN